MKKTAFCIATFFLVMVFPCICLADDITMYSNANVVPNVLILFDNSGSMNDTPPYCDANYNNNSEGCSNSGTYSPSLIYQYQCTTKKHTQTCAWVQISDPSFHDNNTGCDVNNPSPPNQNAICTGDYINYYINVTTNKSWSSKIAAAQSVINNLITNTQNYVRYGVMVLNAKYSVSYNSDLPNYQTDNNVLSSTYGGAIIQDRTPAQITTLE